jgi:hypothetical protein
MTNSKIDKVVVGAAKRRENKDGSGEHVLSTGVRVRLSPVSMTLLQETQQAIPDPEVPMWENVDKGTFEPNPDHPDYLKALNKADVDRNRAALDTMIMFGVELLDGIPDDGWVDKLRFSKRLGISTVDVDDFDLESDIEKKYLYTRYVAVSTKDMVTVMNACAGVSEEEVAAAVRSFQGDEE